MATQEDDISNSLRIKQRGPLNAEPDVAELVEYPITPEGLIYIRNHCPINQFDPATFTLRVDGEVAQTLQFTLHDLMHAFPHKHVVAAMQCAGNRRKAMVDRRGKPAEGVLWGEGVVANVRWTGVSLRDVLLRAGVAQAEGAAANMHVCFSSHAAACQDDEFFGGSIPLSTALDEAGDVLIAFAMNGHPLPASHGFPFRMVVPSFSGVRWVKWVDRITISRTESPNFYHQQDYKVLPASVQTHAQATAEAWWARVPPLQTTPLNSVIASARVLPSGDATAPAPTVFAKGYAVRGPGGQVRTVALSADRGRTWAPAHITYQEGRWSWTLWEAALVVPQRGRVVLWSRATDESGVEQMPECDWNLRGMAYCAVGEYTIEL